MGESKRVNKMQKTIIGYVPKESPIYDFHPMTRLILFIITGFIPVFIDIPELNLLFIVVIFGLFIYAKVDLKKLKIYLPMMFTVGLFVFLTYWLAPGKDPANIEFATLFGKPLYIQPIRWALVSYIRILALLFAAIFYFSTNKESDILVGFRAMKVPFVISYFIGLSLRSAGMFIEDLHTIREAEQARGLDAGALTFSGKVKHYSMYMIPLFTLALRRADEISNALYCKGFSFAVSKNRVDYALSKHSIKAKDRILTATFLSAFVATIYFRLATDIFIVENSFVNLLFY